MKVTVQKRKARRLVFVIAMIALVFLSGLTAYWVTHSRASIRNDRVRFEDGDKEKQLVFEKLVEKLGASPLQIADKNACYNSEHGPYDNGRLWCQTAVAAYFVQEFPEPQIRPYFIESVKEVGSKVASSANLVFWGAENLPCSLMIYNGPSAISPGYYLPENRDAKQTLVMVCSSRSEAKHYPYIAD